MDMTEYNEEFIAMTIAGAIAQFGLYKQLTKAMEECAELIQSISKFLNGDLNANVAEDLNANVAEEVADVEIMCAQLRQIVGSELVDTWKKKKIIRLAERTGLYLVSYGKTTSSSSSPA